MARKPSAVAIDPAAFDTPAATVHDTSLADEITGSYLEYAYSVIHARALPDARDGLKPVHRRILYGMHGLNLTPTHAYVKSARVVGEVMGRLHPHGDSAIYDALVRLAQDFSMNVTLVDGHGNFGSPDDAPAAARYCVTGDARVRLADGRTLPIQDLVPDAAPNSDTDINIEVLDKDGKPVTASKFFHSGIHPTIRFTTRCGYSLRGSENHLVLCLEAPAGVPLFQWRRLDELKPGMYVAVARNAWQQVMPTIKEYMTGVLLGGWITEGWCNDNRGGFNNTDQAFFEEVLTSYDALVGGNRYVYNRQTRRDRKRIWELDVQNLQWLSQSVLAEVIGTRSAQKTVPNAVWSGGMGVKRAFLMAAFEGDGGVRGATQSGGVWRNNVIQYCTFSEELCDGIQELLLEFGITASKRRYRRASGNIEYRLILSGVPVLRAFYERVGFLPTKQAKLREALERAGERTGLGHDKVPFVADYVQSVAPRGGRHWLKQNSISYPHRWRAHRKLIHSKLRSNELISVLEPIMESGYRFDPITSVEQAEPAPVFSLRVDSDDHSFLAGGFVNHNTECRMTNAALLLTGELGEDTVDVSPTYDGSATEPVVLPAAYPNLVVNGGSGIAVGMATNMITHNLTEVIAATRHLIKHPDARLDTLMRFIPGPDLPTGGQVLGADQVRQAYETGKGVVRIRATADIGPLEGSRGRQAITFTTLPYQVGAERIIEAIKTELGKKRLQGISDIKDLTDRIHGIRLMIECKAGVNPQALLAELYKYTPLETTFGISNLALVDGQPRLLGLRDMLTVWLEHRYEVVTRRTRYRLDKVLARLHIVDGLLIALANIDEVIAIIKKSKDTSEAATALQRKFRLSDIQARHILDMPLRRLTALEVETLRNEKAELETAAAALQEILDSDDVLRGVVDSELAAVAKANPTERRTELVDGSVAEVLAAAPVAPLEVADDPCTVLLSSTGMIGRTPSSSDDTPNARKRGRGSHDVVIGSAATTARGQVVAVTNTGRAFKVDVVSLPIVAAHPGVASLKAGIPGNDLLPLEPHETVVGVVPAAADGLGVGLVTRQGTVKITRPDWPVRSDEFAVVALADNDTVLSARWVTDTDEFVLVSSDASLLRFPVSKVRPQGLSGGGVAGISLTADAAVVFGATVTPTDDTKVVTYTGTTVKTSRFADFPAKGRATGGVRSHRFLRDETTLVNAVVTDTPAAADGLTDVTLPADLGRRDGSGQPVDTFTHLGDLHTR